MKTNRALFIGIIGISFTALVCHLPEAQAQPCMPGWDREFAQTGFDGPIYDSVTFDDGSGPAPYVVGIFGHVDGQAAVGIAKWNGRRWTDVGGGLQSDLNGLGGYGWSVAVWDDGSGPALYVGGFFNFAGGVPAKGIAKWNGHAWAPVGGGVNGWATELAVFDDGRGEALYVGGHFFTAGNQRAQNIARWDGADWEPLGDGLSGGGNRVVTALMPFDDGGGPALYVGGEFRYLDGSRIESRYLGRWNGHEWSALPGVQLEPGPTIFVSLIEKFEVFDDGTGPALFMAGNMTQPGVGTCFLKWDGHDLTAPAGLFIPERAYPEAMAVEDDGNGPMLWLGGGAIGYGDPSNIATIARWDGATWSTFGSYPDVWVYALTLFNDGFGNAMYVAGDLQTLQPGGEPLSNIVRWTTPHMSLAHSPLRAGESAQFSTTCSTPGARVNFVYSTRGLGRFSVPQLGITLDLNHPQLAGSGIADQDGVAELIRTLPPGSTGRMLYMQAAEPGRKSEVVEATIE